MKYKMYKCIIVKTILLVLCTLCSNLALAYTIKIGIAGPFSGPYVAAGDQQWLGALQAVEDINAAGGVNASKLVLVTADDACNPQKAVAIAKRFVESNVMAVIGHNCSSATLAAAKVYAEANMLMITPASTTPEITQHNYSSIFRTCGTDDAQSEIVATFIVQKLKAKKIAIVYDESIYGKVVAKHTKSSLEKIGVSPVLYRAITHDKSNNSALIRQISKLQPQVVYFGGLHTDAGNFLKYLRESGNNATFFGSDGIASPDFVQAAGGPNIVKNVYMTFFTDPKLIYAAKKVIKRLEAKRIKPTGYMLNSYAAVQVIAAAIENAPKDKMSEWLHHNKVDSVIGELEWDQNGDLITAPFTVYKWNDEGEYAPYWTP